MTNLRGKRVILGVTGGIACYKSADLASKLAQQGAQVDVILTSAAEQFITPTCFSAVTGRQTWTDRDMYAPDVTGAFPHIALARAADVVIIAPITANTLAKLANGLADNLLTTTVLATRAPLILAPAMETHMWEHPATQANVQTLRARGAHVVGPELGHLASGATGIGRMAEPTTLLEAIRYVLGQNGPLRGYKVLITAGATREPIDPVRFITNPSSGKMGVALAAAARDAGATTVLVHGPINVPVPYGVRTVPVTTAQEMLDAVLAEVEDTDVFIAAAAVADFRPTRQAAQKLKKDVVGPTWTLTLERTPDILGTVGHLRREGHRPYVVVGFAAETQNLIAAAQEKLTRKGLDLIVANDITAPDAGFAVDTNRVTVIEREGTITPWPTLPKDVVAERLMVQIIDRLRKMGILKAESDDTLTSE